MSDERREGRDSRTIRPATLSVLLSLLVGVLSVTTLAAQNATRGIRIPDLALPLSFALLVALTSWVAAGIAARASPFRGILGAILTGAALFGGRVVDLLVAYGASPWVGLVVLVVAVAGAGVMCVRKSIRIPEAALRFSVVSAFILVLLNAVQMRPLVWPNAAPVGMWSQGVGQTPVDGVAELPNIYFILLDAYSGPESLSEIYDTDISPTIDSLVTLGFDVPDNSRANYTSTFLAMGAMLGWNYLDELVGPLAPSKTDRTNVYALLHDNATTRVLRDHGYRIVYHRSSYPPLRSSPVADLHIPPFGVGEFQVAWLNQTALLPALRIACDIASCRDGPGLPFVPDGAQDLRGKFEALAKGEGAHHGPTFHYAHFLLPHEPLLFKADCTHRAERYWGVEGDDAEGAQVRQWYADQVACTNRLTLDTVRRILEREEIEPVIIVQSDHGYARFPTGRPLPLDSATSDQVRERMDIFAAYYMPGHTSDLFYEGITPVNAFRIIFSEVFKLNLHLLPDRSYWSSFERPFDFIPLD